MPLAVYSFGLQHSNYRHNRCNSHRYQRLIIRICRKKVSGQRMQCSGMVS